MNNVKLSKRRKLTIVGVTFFSAIILGGLNTTKVSATVDDQQVNSQTVNQNEVNGTISENGTDAETGFVPDTKDNADEPDNSSKLSRKALPAGNNNSDDQSENDINDNTERDNQIPSVNETVSSNSDESVSDSSTPASKEIPVSDSQGDLLDWNNRNNYDPSANSGIIINYKIKGTDGAEQNAVTNQRGDRIFVGNAGDTVDLTKSLPDGYALINESDRIQTIGVAYDGTNASSYIDGITKTVYVTRAEGSTAQVLPVVYGFKYGEIKFPSLYITYLDENMGPSGFMTSLLPIGFRTELTSEPNPVTYMLYNGIHSNRFDKPIIKDELTKLSNSVNFVLGNKTISTKTMDEMQIGNTTSIAAPAGYKFSDGTTTKTITIGAASPMYMAYYESLGITDIDPSVHDFSIIKDPSIASKKNVTLDVEKGKKWSPSETYDAINSTDENGNSIPYENLTSVEIKKNGTDIPETGVNIDLSEPATYTVIYRFNDYSSSTVVNVVKNTVEPTIKVHDSNLKPGESWNVKDNFDSAMDEYGEPLDISRIKVDSSKIKPDIAGVYNVIFTYGNVSSIAKVTVTQLSTLAVKPSTVHVGTKWDANSSFVSATDENGNAVDLSEVMVDSSKLDIETPGVYNVIYSYDGITRTVPVTVTQDATMELKPSSVRVGEKWNASSSFVSATDENGNSVDLSKVSIDSSKLDIKTPGTYDVIFAYGGLIKTTQVKVLPNSNNSSVIVTPSSDKKWVINAPYLVKADNYARIYSSPSLNNPVKTRSLAHDTDWMVGSAIQNSEGTFYKVATHEWVKAEDMWAFKQVAGILYVDNSNNAEVYSTVDVSKRIDRKLGYQTAWVVDRIAIDGAGNTLYRVGVGNYVKSSDVTEVTSDTKNRGVVKVTGNDNVALYHLDYYGNVSKASRAVAGGTAWISNSKRELNGITYYKVSSSEWISENDSVFVKQN
ncbi:bacterial Ig-like domain-containing protein [Companilactobacillus hulinensis]|uniref:bacterial Ig-like domain-containing protein n=1 Tax=Companilactobacillus hulinensis TaxID=2486007 RepID=UPI000F7A1A1F|nr:bacterial Ig-like domain-containing protein [Companilactobacillus hulinensis]